MAFLGPSDLKIFLNDQIITPFDINRIEQAAYELSLGKEIYRTDAKDGKIELLDSKNRTVEINPGQFTLLLTKETITIPSDKLAFISIKAKHKLKGLVNVSGFHVDPGFKGQLLFSVYNAGPSTITLETSKPYFLIWFAELKTAAIGNDVYNSTSNNHQNQQGIPTDYIDALKRGELASPNSILKKIGLLENGLQNSIKDVERKKVRNEYLLTLLIGLLISVAIKLYWDSKAEEYGYQKRKSEESALQEITEKIDLINTNAVSLSKTVDSLRKVIALESHEATK